MSAANHTQDLPAVVESRVGDALVQTSDARELHRLLKVGRDFTTWIKGRIAQYGFVEGVDFVTTEYGSPDRGNQAGRGGDRRSVTYHLTLGTAKEIAMVENNAEGRRIRRYFIECERRALDAAARPAPDLSDPHALRALLLAHAEREIALEARAEKAEGTLALAAPKAAALDRIADTTGLILPSDAAKTLGLRPKDLTQHMLGNGWLFRRLRSGRLAGRQDKLNARLLAERSVAAGENRTEIQAYVTPRGLTRLAQELGVPFTPTPDLFSPAPGSPITAR